MPRSKKTAIKPPGALDFERNSWTPKIAAAWAGVPERTLYRLLRDGAVPCLPMGESQDQKWPKAHDGKRRRTCFRFLIPRVAFIKWWESIGKPDTKETAA
jgi:hypothetical protein